MPTGWNALFRSLQGEVRTSAITQPKGVGEAKKKKKSSEGSSLPTEFLYFLRFTYLLLLAVWGLFSNSCEVVSGGYSSLQCVGLLPRWLLLQGPGSRHMGSVVLAHRPSCSASWTILLDQGSNLFPCIGRQILNH